MPRSTLLHSLLLGAGFGAAVVFGQYLVLGQYRPHLLPGATGALHAQGRGPVNAPADPAPVPAIGEDEPIVYPEDNGGSSSSTNGFLAVTGSYGVGTSVLYLVDTQSRQLAVYEARGGAPGQRRLVLVGARRIDLDLQLRGYNDQSEYDYRALETLFEKGDRKADTPTPPLDKPAAQPK